MVRLHGAEMYLKANLHEIIKEILNTRPVRHIHDESEHLRHAGVLVPLMMDGGRWDVVFTKRTNTVEHHKGQISFPGGAVDEEDSSVEETVLREVHEEIGIPREEVEILGRIDDTLTMVSSFLIHPYVGLVPRAYQFRVNKKEVERIIRIPLEIFHPEISGSRGSAFEYEGEIYYGPTFEYQDEVIWGATAKIMLNFMEIVGSRILLPGTGK